MIMNDMMIMKIKMKKLLQIYKNYSKKYKFYKKKYIKIIFLDILCFVCKIISFIIIFLLLFNKFLLIITKKKIFFFKLKKLIYN